MILDDKNDALVLTNFFLLLLDRKVANQCDQSYANFIQVKTNKIDQATKQSVNTCRGHITSASSESYPSIIRSCKLHCSASIAALAIIEFRV